MSTVKKRGFSIDDFRALPEVRPVLEFFGGRVMQKMSPRLRHSVIQTRLSSRLLVYGEPSQLGLPYVELRCEFGGASYVFDLSFFAWGRCPDLSSVDDCSKVKIAPDLAVEILSPGQTVGELSRKLRSAIRRGVQLGWLVNERRREILTLRSGVRTRILRPGDILDGGDVVPGFTIPVAELFGWLDGGRGPASPPGVIP